MLGTGEFVARLTAQPLEPSLVPPMAPEPSASDDGQRQGELFETDPPPWELLAEEDVVAAEVVFSETPHGPFHYRIPDALRDQIAPGMRIHVPLGRGNRAVVGWCIGVGSGQHPRRTLKDVKNVYDDEPLCDANLVKLVLWMSHYYQSPAAQVFDALVPSGVRSAAGTRKLTLLTPAAKAFDHALVDKLPDKQRAAVERLSSAGRPLTPAQLAEAVGCSEEPIRRLRRKGFFEEEMRRVLKTDAGTYSARQLDPAEIPELTESQAAALQRVLKAIDQERQQTLLLQGVTGSGKTEVYIRAIEHVVRQGKQAIVLVPEISLTPQTRQRFQERFAEVAVLHSQMTPSERHHHWQRIRSGHVQVVVGPRSAIFAPLPRLGLIVIDEEHDASFKQDTTPRYHARKVAGVRSKIEKIPLLLGTATPALETWHAAQTGAAEWIQLPSRIANRPMPEVQLIDLRLRGDRSGGGAISRPLHVAVRETLAEKGQTILLLNRRGFATTIQCPACGHVVACPDCDMPLTHHRDGGRAICHYCDYTIATPPWCPVCRFDGIRYSGLGTQKLEMEVKSRFPTANVARMDSDTMRRPGSHERVLTAFRNGEIQILLGTQMIAKGLDFPNVLLVGVINADSALHFPDFRAAERTFQLVTQVAGRTGRGSRGGRVIVQTFTPEHPAIQAASRHDYQQFAETEMAQRRKYGYPPLGSVARIIVRGPLEETAEAFAETIVEHLEKTRTQLGTEVRILGPAPPPIAKLRGKYRFHIMLQAAAAGPLGETIRRAVADLKPPSKEEIQFVIDIDPMDML